MDVLNAGLKAALPTGSYVTVEWPTNFGGINSTYYTRNQHDYLYDKAVELIDKFYYLSHTWDHPCTLDNLTVANGEITMSTEVSQVFIYKKEKKGKRKKINDFS
jgi:hypothetical protein